MSDNDPEIEVPPHGIPLELQDNVQDWISTISATMAASSVVDFSDNETEAGPSMTYAERQASVMSKLSAKFRCVVCYERFNYALMVPAICSHRYCGSCAKDLFMRSTKDEELFPPRCCKKSIPLKLVSKYMETEELAAFKLASVEFATTNRTYCSNRECNMFIDPTNIKPGLERADCSKCGTETCSTCKNAYHFGMDCPDDPSLSQTRELARDMGWQTCFACNRVIQLRTGCNHITCLCGAQFCYVCGTQWKQCGCATADPNRIEERAEEVVNRDAPLNLPPIQWRQRVDQVFAELQENHECEHSRRFQRITVGAPRRGFRCELCDMRHHKYILQCRHCYLNVCEDCRRNRI